MTKRMMILATLAAAALASNTARAECQAQRAHEIGCTLECVRARTCSDSSCYSIIAACNAYFATQDGTRCGAFCQRNRGGTYRTYATCLQQCNSGPMPSKQARPPPGSAAKPGKPSVAKRTPQRPTFAKPGAQVGAKKAPPPARKAQLPPANQHKASEE